MLIYGTIDMKAKMYQFNQRQDRKKLPEEDDDNDKAESPTITNITNKKKSCKERMKFSYGNKFLTVWDGVMLAVITYSCFTSMYFAAIYFDICDDTIFYTENLVTFFFLTDIILRFMRMPNEN